MDANLLPSRVDDLKHLCIKSNSPKFIGFLTPEEALIATKQFTSPKEYNLFGGYDGAERVMLAVLPDWCEEAPFPITAITFTYRQCDALTHRDFLGALMSLGITRECIGDILVENGRAVAFVNCDIAKFVMTQIQKVGNVGVTLTEGFVKPLPQLGKKQSFAVTVASTRLDCVIASLCGISRRQASDKISDNLVLINSVSATKLTVNVNVGDKITVRKKGKFIITSCDELSKKGRIILKYDKYI